MKLRHLHVLSLKKIHSYSISIVLSFDSAERAVLLDIELNHDSNNLLEKFRTRELKVILKEEK